MEATGKYGQYDQRKNIYELDQLNLNKTMVETVKRQALGVGCLIPSNCLEKKIPSEDIYQFKGKFKSQTLSQRIQKERHTVFGEQEAFANELSVGDGTAFLIDKKLALTCAHCICKRGTDNLDLNRLKSLRLVFGFQMTKENQCKDEFAQNEVYKIKKVVAHKYNKNFYEGKLKGNWDDWALIKLDREVEGLLPLKLNFNKLYEKGEKVYMLGYPCGQPLKFTGNGEITYPLADQGDNSFQVSLDAFIGNSGSPVFEENTNEVVGILASGNDDFEVDNNYRGTGQIRMKVASVTDEIIANKGHEKCQKMESLDFIKAYMKSPPQPPAVENEVSYVEMLLNFFCIPASI